MINAQGGTIRFCREVTFDLAHLESMVYSGQIVRLTVHQNSQHGSRWTRIEFMYTSDIEQDVLYMMYVETLEENLEKAYQIEEVVRKIDSRIVSEEPLRRDH